MNTRFRLCLGIVSICFGVAACAKDFSLAGTSWQLVSLGPNGALEGAQPTLAFESDGRVSGSGSCNRFSGSVTESGKVLQFGPLATTKMACDDAINAQESTFFKALEQADSFEAGPDQLSIQTKLWSEPLSFVKAAP